MQRAQDLMGKNFRWDLATYRKHLPYLTHFLSTLLRDIGRVERKVATARYIEGLLMPGRGKFIRPLAERLGVDAQSLQQAVTNSRWDDNQIWTALRAQIAALLEPLPIWVVSERAWEKQGDSTVGVANQRCGADGKRIRCQISVEILGSNGSMAMPLANQLHLPEEWVEDEARRRRAEIPDSVQPATKPELAIQLIQQIAQDGLRPGMVQADSVYGNDRNFRTSLARLGIEFLLEVDSNEINAWDFDSDVPLRPGDLQPQATLLSEIASHIPEGEWCRVSWVKEHRFAQTTRLAFREIFVDPGPANVHGSLERLLLVIDWPEDMPKPYRTFLANWDYPRSEGHCLRYIRSDAYRKHYRDYFEDSLDLASYQGRSWTGFHHHLVLAAAAYFFVLTLEQRTQASFWSELSPDLLIDSAVKAETQRLAGILLRSGVNVEPGITSKRPSFVPAPLPSAASAAPERNQA